MEHPKLELRPLNHTDADVLAGWAADDRFCRHTGWALRAPAAVQEFWVRQVDSPPADLIRLAATSASEGLVGYVDLHGVNPRERELGFVVGPSDRWGRGLGRRAAEAGLTYGFEELSMDSVWAEAVAVNVASVRILRSLDMRETGQGAAETFLDRDSHYLQFRITRDEWSTGSLKR